MQQYDPYFMGKQGFNWFLGIVEDVNDPLRLGRVRVRVLGHYTDNLVEMPTNTLPWSHCLMPTTSASQTQTGQNPRLVPGSQVMGFFLDGEHMQNPVVMGSFHGIPESIGNISNGFTDPRTPAELANTPYTPANTVVSGESPKMQINEVSATDRSRFPRADFFNTSTTNILATNPPADASLLSNTDININETVLATDLFGIMPAKRNSRNSGHVDIALASGGKFNEPTPPFNAKYPYNNVMQTESGHVQEWDDTPGAERIHTYHRSGSFIEFHPDGTQVNKSVGKSYFLTNGESYTHVGLEMNQTVDGGGGLFVNAKRGNGRTYNVRVGAGASYDTIVEDGDYNITLPKGTMNITAANINLLANTNSTSTISIKANILDINPLGAMYTENTTGSKNETVQGSKVVSAGSISHSSGLGPYGISSGGAYSISVGQTSDEVVLNSQASLTAKSVSTLTGGIVHQVGILPVLGSIEIDLLGSINITSTTGPLGVTIGATVGPTSIDGALVQIGGLTAVDPLIKSVTFFTDFMTHLHLSPFGPTGGVTPDYATKIMGALSTKAFTA